VARIKILRNLLTSGRVVARGTFAMTGMVGKIDKQQWVRAGLSIDVRNSDLLEAGRTKPVVRWSGLTLHVPAAHIRRRPVTDAKSPVRKPTAHHESIAEAIRSMWPKGTPSGLSVQVRDQRIIDWQKENGRQVTSSKTIQRYYSGK
jgi:hypothetical protein